MGWFSRSGEGSGGGSNHDGAAAGGGEAGHDAELTFFRVDEAQRFRALVRREVAELGWEMTVLPGSLVSDDGRQWGLWNVGALGARCRAR